MKTLVTILVYIVGGLLSNVQAISVFELRNISNEILNANGLPYQATIRVDDIESSGFASIQYSSNSNHVNIYVHSSKLSSKSANTWAFVMGHEFAHKSLGRGGTPKSEWDADIRGAKWAINSGYSVSRYIEDILNNHNSCDPAHGCWHSRAHNIARRYSVRINGSSEEPHKAHKPADGPYPSRGGSRCQPQRRHVPPAAPRVVEQRVPCIHRVPCQHTYYNGRRYVRMHSHDLLHRYDVQYITVW